MSNELADPDALIGNGKMLLLFMPSAPTATQAFLHNPPRTKDAAQTARLRRWFEWISTRVGNGQIVAYCVTEDELRAAWLRSKNG